MSVRMTKMEREAFLAEVHIGVLSVVDGDRGPSSAPIWYLYEAGGDIQVMFGQNLLLPREAGELVFRVTEHRCVRPVAKYTVTLSILDRNAD